MSKALIPARNAPTIITIAHMGGLSFAVAYDGGKSEQLGWEEMLGQVACLTAPAFIADERDEKDPLILTLVNQGMGGWRLMIDATPDGGALPFDRMLGRLIGLTFPTSREPGAPLFGHVRALAADTQKLAADTQKKE